MSTTHHTPLGFHGPLTSAYMEAPLGQLDAAIVAVDDRLGTGALDAAATAGYLLVPVMVGPPSGVPTATPGFAPMVVDTSSGRLYVYHSGGWHYVTLT